MQKDLNFEIIVRSILFNIFFFFWVFGYSLITLPISALSQKIAQKVGYIWSVVILKALKIICKLDIEISGQEHLPKKAAIIAAKHESAWDTIFFLSLLKNPVYVLKKELIFIPFFGLHLILMKMIYIDRSKGKTAISKMQEQVNQVLNSNRSVVIFPQGTRTKPGEQIPYKSGIYALAAAQQSAIHPVALNSGSFWPKKSFFKYPGTIKVAISPAIPFNKNKKTLMGQLETQLEKSYGELKN